MNNELLLFTEKLQDVLIEQIKTKPQETPEFKMNNQMENFSFTVQKHLAEQGKWLLAVTSFEAINSVFNKTNGNNIFSITTPGHWNSKSAEKTIDELIKLLELRYQNDTELHVEKVKKRGNHIKIGDKEYKLSDFDNRKNEKLKELKSASYHDLEDLVNRMQLTFCEIIDKLDVKYVPSKKIG